MNKIGLLLSLIIFGVSLRAQNECYRVRYHTKINEYRGNFTATLDPIDRIGRALADIGDLDNDGVNDVLAGAISDDDGGTDRGAVYILFMNANGTVKSHQKISNTTGGFTAPLHNSELFGSAATNLGDLNDDGVTDVAVGAFWNNDGGSLRGAVYILFLKSDGTVKSYQKISDTGGGFTGVLDNNDRFGKDVENIGDINGDGITDLAVCAHLDDDGGTDRGAVWILFLDTNGTVKGHQKISETSGGFTTTLDNQDRFGSSVASLGDFNADGIPDIAVGASRDDDGGTNRGAVYILMLDTNGTVKSEIKISQTTGSFTGTIGPGSTFGHEVTNIGDLNADGTVDLFVTSPYDNDGGTDQGAGWIVLLKQNGTVKNQFKISELEGNFFGDLKPDDYFGFIADGLGDYNHDGYLDVAVHGYTDDGGFDKGAFWILTLEPCPDTCSPGPQIIYQKIQRGDSSDVAHSIAEVSGGGFLIAGISKSGRDAGLNWFVMKTNHMGDTIWANTYGGGADEFKSINLIETTDGGCIVVGKTFSFGGTNGNIYVLKLDANGAIEWEKRIGGSNIGDEARSVIQTSDGSYLIVGGNGYAIRLNANGTTRWNSYFNSGSTFLEFNDVAETTYGDFILCGTAGYGAGNRSGWLVRLDSLGNKIWERIFDDGSVGGFTSVIASADGGYLTCGKTAITASTASTGILLLKSDSTGIFEWSRSYSSGSSVDEGVHMNRTADGGLIISANTANYSSNRNLLLRTDRYGNEIWSKAYPGNVSTSSSSTAYGDYITETADGGFAMVNFSYNFTLDTDIHLIKMNSCGESGCHEVNTILNITEMEPTVSAPITSVGTYGSSVNTSTQVLPLTLSDTTLCEFDPKCQLVADFISDTACFGDTTHFTDLSSDNLATIVQWDWDFGDGNSSTASQNITHLYAAPGFYQARLKVVNNDTLYCADSITKVVQVKSFPQLELGNDSTLCQGDTLILDATDTSATYLWQDNSTNSLYFADTSGSYFVESVRNGCSATDTIDLIFNSRPPFNLGPDTAICLGDSLVLDATVALSYSYLWQDNSTQPTYLVVSTGIYIVEVSDTVCTWDDSINVTVKPNPVVSLGSDSTLCSGDTLKLDVSNTGATYSWQDSSTDSIYQVFTGGLYHVEVDLNGCLKKDSVNLTFNTKPSLNLGNDTVICEGDTVELDATTPNFYYLWQDNSTQSTFNASSAGTYYVRATDSVCTVRDTINLSVDAIPALDLGNDTSICDNRQFVLSGFSPSGSYLWQDSSTASSYLVDKSGLYTLQVSSAGANCKVTDSININVLHAPQIALGPDTTLCEGDSVILDASAGAQSYLWQHNGSKDSIIIVSDAGLYRVVASNSFCTDTSERIIRLDSFPLFDLGSNTAICEGDSLVPEIPADWSSYMWSTGDTVPVISLKTDGKYYLTVNNGVCSNSDSIRLRVNDLPSGLEQQLFTLCENRFVIVDAGNTGSTYLWSTGATTQTIRIEKTGVYSVQVMSPEGCSRYQEFVVQNCQSYFFIPNTITPNGDGSNDTWIIRNIDSYPNNSVRIYNRNGYLLYEKSGYDNSWNGTYNGDELPETTYFYVLDLGDGKDVFKGTLTIVRE